MLAFFPLHAYERMLRAILASGVTGLFDTGCLSTQGLDVACFPISAAVCAPCGEVQKPGEGDAHWDQSRLPLSQNSFLLWRHTQVCFPVAEKLLLSLLAAV